MRFSLSRALQAPLPPRVLCFLTRRLRSCLSDSLHGAAAVPLARARRHFAEAVIPRPTDRFRGRRRFGAHAVLHSGNEQKFQQRRRTKANLCCFSNFDGRGRQVFKFNNLDEDRLFFTNNFNHCEVSPRGAQFFIETKGRVAA